MTELALSIMATMPDPDHKEDLLRLLAQFEAQTRIHVNLRVLTWMEGWTELVKVALYGHGPDVSEIGSTWMSSLVGMNALLPFSEWDISSLGGPNAFLPSAWQSVSLAGEQQVYAIPWLAGTRYIFYRRDLLEMAGVEESSAFLTHQRLENTLQQLQASGIDAPWVVPTQHTLNTLHYVASWVWGAGGHFVDEEGRRPVFHQKNAVKGMSQYFGLGRYLPQPARDLDDTLAATLFWQGEAAVTIDGRWALPLHRETVPSQVLDNLGSTSVPGVSFVGGSNLVIWKHTRRADAAMKLIRFLTSERVQIEYGPCVRLFPARTSALDSETFAADPLIGSIKQGLKTGRSFQSLRLWGLIEDRLTVTLAQIWKDVLDAPRSDVAAVIRRHLEPLADELRLILSPP